MMAQAPVVITLTPAQRTMIRTASGKNVAELGIEPLETGSGWLCTAGGGKKFWLLKHADPESHMAARRKHQPRIDSRHARFRLKIGESRIHRWGVFAEERIPARRNVIEYVGEHVNPFESYRRAKNATEVYTLQLDKFWRIDGSVGGSGAEFINHSCDPNLCWRRFPDRVLCQSLRPIAAGEELTLDYRFSNKSSKVRCLCGSPKCRGTINVATSGRSKSRSKPRVETLRARRRTTAGRRED
jgi:hypothetical protein